MFQQKSGQQIHIEKVNHLRALSKVDSIVSMSFLAIRRFLGPPVGQGIAFLNPSFFDF